MNRDNAEVNAWMSSPKAISGIEGGDPWLRHHGFANVASLGEQALFKLRRDDDACELARLVLFSEPELEKKCPIKPHRVLGQAAAKRGNLGEADGHFASALEEAKLSRLPVLAARDTGHRDWGRVQLLGLKKAPARGAQQRCWK